MKRQYVTHTHLTRERILELILEAKKRNPSNPMNTSISDQVSSAILYLLANEDIFRPYLVELNRRIAKLLKKDFVYSPPQTYRKVALGYNFPGPPAELLSKWEYY